MLALALYLSPFRITVIAICVALLVLRMVLRIRGRRNRRLPERRV
jgi:uncharacterized membrane protein SirB2